jgi:MoaA/NifB/PqqE/SkfB family radical SAM enzyme
MKLSGLHLLLTYQCTFECDHCFVWGSPRQRGTLTLAQIGQILNQAQEAGVEWIYFEGGEPFLYYALLVRGVTLAAEMGFKVGVVSNGYWAQTVEDALIWLQPLVGKLEDLSISCDFFHASPETLYLAHHAVRAAEQLSIPVGTISVAQPEEANAASRRGKLESEVQVMYRGRAVQTLAPRAIKQPWVELTDCPHEDLREPGRVHLDPLGNVQICQGISLGNVFQQPLKEICAGYDPETHPICGPLLLGGPAALVTKYILPHEPAYADACHLCDEARTHLRARFPEILGPDQVYGFFPEGD